MRQQRGARSGAGAVAHQAHLGQKLPGDEPDGGRGGGAQVRAERAADDELVDLVDRQPRLVQKARDPRGDRRLGQLQRADVLLGERDRPRGREARDWLSTADRHQVGAVGGQLVGRQHAPGLVDDTRFEARRQRVDEAGSAHAHRLRIAQRGDAERAVLEAARDDRPVARLHPLGDVGALERGAGRRGAADELAVRDERHLAVGAQIGEERAPPAARSGHAAEVDQLVKTACDQAGGDVAAHIARHARAQIRPAQSGHRALDAEQRLGLEGIDPDALRRDAAQDVLHHRVAGDRPAPDARRIDPRLGAQVARELQDAARCGIAQHVERARGAGVDPADDVGPERGLGVGDAAARQKPRVGRVEQVDGDGRRAQIDRDAQLARLRRVAAEPRQGARIRVGALHMQAALRREGAHAHALLRIRLACEDAHPRPASARDVDRALAAGPRSSARRLHRHARALQCGEKALTLFHGHSAPARGRIMRFFDDEDLHGGNSFALLEAALRVVQHAAKRGVGSLLRAHLRSTSYLASYFTTLRGIIHCA